jgi:hypothetical protein
MKENGRRGREVRRDACRSMSPRSTAALSASLYSHWNTNPFGDNSGGIGAKMVVMFGRSAVKADVR